MQRKMMFAAAELMLACLLPCAGAMAAPTLAAVGTTNTESVAQRNAPTNILQGRIVSVIGSIIRVKTPDYGPGLHHGPGIHAMFIVSGPSYNVDIAHARVYAANGKHIAAKLLNVGEQVTVRLARATQPDDRNLNAKPISAVSVEQSADASAPQH